MQFDLHDTDAISVIETYLNQARMSGKSVGLATGSYDLLHYHHVLFFTRCRRDCDILFVGIDSDELVRERKGEGRPIIYDSRRVQMVDALKPVAFAFIMHSLADHGTISRIIKPDFIFKNDAFVGREAEIVGREHAGKIKIIRDVVEHTSTTQIISEAARLVAKRP